MTSGFLDSVGKDCSSESFDLSSVHNNKKIYYLLLFLLAVSISNLKFQFMKKRREGYGLCMEEAQKN